MHLVLLDDEVFRQLCAKHLQSAHLLCNYSGLAPKLQALPDWSSGVEHQQCHYLLILLLMCVRA